MKRIFQVVAMLTVVCLALCLPPQVTARETKTLNPATIKAPAPVTAPVTAAPPAVGGVTKSAKPDLVVSTINFSPGAPIEGAEITLYIFVKNVGPVRAEAFGTRVKVGGEQNPPVIQVPGLNPNQEWKYVKKVTFDHATNYIVTVTADAGSAIVESNEGNNVKQATITVHPAPKPDLVVTKINFSPGSPKQHQQVQVWYFVKNLGPGKSPVATLSTTNSLNAYSIWHTTQVPALDPGKEWRYDGLFLSNSAGSYFLKAVIDRGGQIAETNELNNELERPIVVSSP